MTKFILYDYKFNSKPLIEAKIANVLGLSASVLGDFIEIKCDFHAKIVARILDEKDIGYLSIQV